MRGRTLTADYWIQLGSKFRKPHIPEKARDGNCGGKVGGRDRDRTCDLMLAKHALSQLSYTPIFATVIV